MAIVDNRENVLVVEDGNVYIYTVTDPKKGYVMSNLTNKTLCPKHIYNCIPTEILQMILEVCSVLSTPQMVYLYKNKWNSEPIG